ncbi:hypothetical protein ACROYT_G030524 [Oculina patagonica]
MRLHELKLAQARKEAEAIVLEERRLAEEELRRHEEERRLNESRRLRELEYEGERLRLQARLEEEEEKHDPESPVNRLHDFEERLNVSWVQQLCDGKSSGPSNRTNTGEMKSVFPRSLPKLELARFDGNPLEWPTFISLFKCLVHDQPLTDTQRMTHLQRALAGNAKKAVGGTLTHGHLYREALKELEEQFGSEVSVAGAYLKTIFDHPEVCEDNFAQLR